MKFLKPIQTLRNSYYILIIIFSISPSYLFGQEPNMVDSLDIKRRKEVSLIVDHIENTYIYGRRGMDSLEWNSRVEMLYKKFRDANSNLQQMFAYRYAGLLISDAHFKFPDGGVYNRYRIFSMNDEVFPIWIKTWYDGSVYCVKDYTATIPKYSEIISVNGHSAKEIALLNRKLMPAEELHGMAYMNTRTEPDPRSWNNFQNFLYAEGIKPPFTVKYINSITGKIDSSHVQPLSRENILDTYKKSGDTRRVAEVNASGFFKKPIRYYTIDKNIGVLSINSFWGRNLIELFLFKRDWTYNHAIKKAMKRIDRDGIDTLIIDITKNMGGMSENVSKTLEYFTKDSIDINTEYYITDSNRQIIKNVIKNTPHKDLGLTKQQRNELVLFIDSIKPNSFFRTDSLFDLQYHPKDVKHYFNGKKVYLLTSNISYSAAQVFSQYFKSKNIGITAGQPCGGYSNISSGNTQTVQLPLMRWPPFAIPYSRFKNHPTFEYEPVDIDIKRHFDEWLIDKDNSLERLIKHIRKDSTDNNIMPAVK